jgi:hypothetical protein
VCQKEHTQTSKETNAERKRHIQSTTKETNAERKRHTKKKKKKKKRDEATSQRGISPPRLSFVFAFLLA